MVTYEQVKDWLKEKENKQKLIVCVCFVVIFLIGFGTGRYDREANHYKLQSNYTTFQVKKPATAEVSKEGDAAVVQPQKGTVAGVATSTPSAACLIKGNISATGKKIYHIPTGSFYKRVKPEQCFTTEDQAKAAGFVKSSR